MFGQQNNGQDQQWQQQNDQYNQGPATAAPVDNGFGGNPAFGHPGAPLPPQVNDVTAPPAPAPDPAQADPTALPAHGTVSNNDLLAIKQEALQELSPLVGHLEQSAEEKFKTTMMMIQAADDHSLLQTAYDLAKQITDDKARAQALLDVVNEINYFTQQHNEAA